ncbi:transcription antitermination factor NusB [Salininema proteolyticum]|uniref:Transcription antitermination protein NusB n=1 Tax=Salininema proteolyticum TaxID=1607685 RepID=A0ABV8U0H5_9ACTN
MGRSSGKKHPELGARSRARARAVEILYEAESRDKDVLDVLAERRRRYMEDPHEAPRLPAYSQELVESVADHLREVDGAITSASQGWTLDRMPAVDRNILRVAANEILFREDVDDVVAIKEAMRVAEQLGSSDDPAFYNAVLDRIARESARAAQSGPNADAEPAPGGADTVDEGGERA